jgi:purine/pyrimidine-nucleoside phosphorylase
MSTDQLQGVSVQTRANVYFDGRCVSHSVTFADGSKKSVGVILPATLTFNTGAPEIMETVAGACEVLLPGATAWQRFGPGERFEVPGNARFEIKVEGEPYHYICHFG